MNVIKDLLLPALSGAIGSVTKQNQVSGTKEAPILKALVSVPAYVGPVVDMVNAIGSGDRKAIIDTAVADLDLLTGVEGTAIVLTHDPKFPPALIEYVSDRVGQIVQAILYAEGGIPLDHLQPAAGYDPTAGTPPGEKPDGGSSAQ